MIKFSVLSSVSSNRGSVFLPSPSGSSGRSLRLQQRSGPIRAEQEDSASSQGPADVPTPRRRRRSRRSSKDEQAEVFSLDNLNPYSMGRKSRAIFDDVWAQLQRIGGPSRSVAPDTVPLELDIPQEYESPRATETTVLVTGATGRVGRILVRKLLLRGYKVRALVRRRGDENPLDSEVIPQVVDVVFGDVGDYKACRAAVEGVDKVICCSSARTTLIADLNRVDDTGVANLTRAFLDARNAAARKAGTIAPSTKIDVAEFKDERYHPFWDIEHVGPSEQELSKKGFYAENRRRNLNLARDTAEAYIDETNCLIFEGAVFSREGYAQVGSSLTELPHGRTMTGTEGILLRILGDGSQYTAIVTTESGKMHTIKFLTRAGYNTIRLPWNTFLANQNDEDVPVALDPAEISHLSIRFDPKTKVLDQVTEPGQSMYDSSGNRFKLSIDWIKALPGGQETDFILVSCAGVLRPDLTPAEKERVVAAKRRGESALRNSGLGYTIVRPGPLAEEAGGYKALVFDQGNRITEKVACADVADVCLKALHDDLARNKTFEMCWEYTPEEGLESWDLLCHFPDKSTGYLRQALSPLQKNT